MYDIRQFKPMLYFLLMLGITGYALAAQAPGAFMASFVLIGLNAWLVKSGHFTPLPRWLANLVTVIGFLYVAMQVRAGIASPILLIAQFLVFLQIMKLYEQRGNRDYAQLLVLSLLLMVAAAISTASLVFGVLLILYLFLSLYCCLLFHLKVETDHAKSAYALPEGRMTESTLRQDQRYLSSSMRRLTGVVSGVAIFSAIAVFLLFPRGTGAGLLAPLQFRPSQTLTGFSDQVSFQNIARITQNNEEIATVRVTQDGKSIMPVPFYFRGMTLDYYSGSDATLGSPWGWSRTRAREEDTHSLSRERMQQLRPTPTEHAMVQEVQLKPTGTPVLFALPGIISIAAGRDMQVRYTPRDGVVQSNGPLLQDLRYTAISTGELPFTRTSVVDAAAQAFGFRQPPVMRSNIDPMVASYARKPEVVGELAARRSSSYDPQPIDEEIAKKIEAHLRSAFTYTLDLTDSRRIEGQDPMVAFLYELKRGHCEYFAGAMTLMCQSLHMNARMVVGFKSDEYNTFGNFFTVRQSHAHAWVEVLTTNGWKTFDPTSAREDPGGARRAAGMWGRVKNFFNYLEYSWANSVIAYDNDNRTSLIQQMENGMTNTAITGSNALNKMQKKLLDPDMQYWTSFQAVRSVMALMIAALLVAVAWFLQERWRLRRRAARIGIGSLPPSDQLRLARQLGFYDQLLSLLERHEIYRPTHQTQMEFTSSLTFLPSDVYDRIQRLTRIFYRIRFGEANLSSEQQKRLSTVLGRLQDAMPKQT